MHAATTAINAHHALPGVIGEALEAATGYLDSGIAFRDQPTDGLFSIEYIRCLIPAIGDLGIRAAVGDQASAEELDLVLGEVLCHALIVLWELQTGYLPSAATRALLY